MKNVYLLKLLESNFRKNGPPRSKNLYTLLKLSANIFRQMNLFLFLHVLKLFPYHLAILIVHPKTLITSVIHTSLDFCPVLLPFVKQSLIQPLNIYFLSMVILVFLTAGIAMGEGWQCMQTLTFH